jgi:hypothetical protein
MHKGSLFYDYNGNGIIVSRARQIFGDYSELRLRDRLGDNGYVIVESCVRRLSRINLSKYIVLEGNFCRKRACIRRN